MSNLEKITKSRKFTTGQVSGFTMVGRQSLYRYVRDFPEFFTETAKQHKQGRRWELDDLVIVQSIRMLYHERMGKEKIRELIKGGWKLCDNQPWTRELQSRLIEATFTAYAEAEEISKQAVAAIDDLENKTFFVEWNLEAFQKLWISVQDLIDEVETIEHVECITGKVKSQMGVRWHGKPPILYELVPLAGNLKDYKVVEGGYDDVVRHADRKGFKHDHADEKESY
jgi:hypothetical protein